MIEKRDVISMYSLPTEVKFCIRCTISNQRPRITFDENGVCSACKFSDHKKSEEFGIHQGLNLIDGTVSEIPKTEDGSFKRKTPHIGWSALKRTQQQDWSNSCLKGIEESEFFYFVHSFMTVPTRPEDELAYCNYEGLSITAAIQKENITGVQFHPEKSGEAGLKILKRFVTI